MSDELKHECAVAMVVLRKPPSATGDFGGTKLSLLLEKQHNRGQDGAGAAILRARPVPGEEPYWIAKSASATPLADLLGAIGKREISRSAVDGASLAPCLTSSTERIFLGHLRYATFGKNDVAFCHPFVHESSDLAHTLLLAGNFNLTNAHELFDDYARHGSFPTSKADGYLICELIAHELGRLINHVEHVDHVENNAPDLHVSTRSTRLNSHLADAIANALKNADGAWTLCGATGDGWAFATRDPHGIRPGFYYIDEHVVVVASERPAIQAAFDVPPEAVKELPPGEALIVSPSGEVQMSELGSDINARPRPCSFERIYFSRANDADIHRERKALGAALAAPLLRAVGNDLENTFFSYIPNSAQVAFHGLLEALWTEGLAEGRPVRFGQVAVKDAKFRTFIADAAARREIGKHVYDVTYGLVRPDVDTLVVLDDSIVRGTTMREAILPMLDRLGPKRIVVASSAPPIRYPDCYGIDMSTLGELVAFRALVNLLGDAAEAALHAALASAAPNPLASLYARFTEEQHTAEIARLLTPPGMRAEVIVVYQTVPALHAALSARGTPPPAASNGGEAAFERAQSALGTPATPASNARDARFGDWYFTGDYPTPGGYRVLRRSLENHLARREGRSY